MHHHCARTRGAAAPGEGGDLCAGERAESAVGIARQIGFELVGVVAGRDRLPEGEFELAAHTGGQFARLDRIGGDDADIGWAGRDRRAYPDPAAEDERPGQSRS